MIIIFNNSRTHSYSYMNNQQQQQPMQRKPQSNGYDCGPEPFIANINEITIENNNYRTTVWTGEHLQLTLMSLKPGEDIGLEMHPHVDQFIRIEKGQGIVKMGTRRDRLDYQARVEDDFAFIVPAGYWHNLVNTGSGPLKVYSIYAPPQHPAGTIHRTKEEAQAERD